MKHRIEQILEALEKFNSPDSSEALKLLLGSFKPTAIALVDAMVALEKLVELQSHYAMLLNGYDGGHRHAFKSAQEWLDRLEELGEI